jgi:hypothetical protein
MSKNAETCPGCHRHCSLASPRCRVGELYARKRARHEEMAREEAAAALAPAREDGGAALGKTMRRVSRALRHGKMTLDALGAEEAHLLGGILAKLDAARPEKHKKKKHDKKKHGKKKREKKKRGKKKGSRHKRG